MQLTRSKKLFLNTITSLANQLVIVICGFILPRMFLVSYGSAVNGLQSSISQFLGFIILGEMGVGAVVQSALYKPLAKKNEKEISQIVCSSERFFRKLGCVLAVYTLGLMIFYPLIIHNEFSFIYTASLILIISISAFAQYFLGMTYRLLLNADQMNFIQLGLHVIALIINTIISVILMKNGFGIHIVKLVASLIYLMQPVLLMIYVHKHYKINHHLVLETEPIKQKWNGLAQHLAAFVLGGTDMVILTAFTTLKEVSVYAVYHLVVNGIKQLVMACTAGVQATLGNMLANQETRNLNKAFSRVEWVMHTITTLLFGITGLLIVPFVKVYTNGVTDVNYIVPAFACLMTLAFALHCIRLPYNIMILAAGHYKETQLSAIIEMTINLVLSIVLVFHYGLIGVAIGTLAALTYRTIYFAWYLSHSIISRNITHFLRHIAVDVISVIFMILCGFLQMQQVSYISWFILACKTAIICIIICLVINKVFYPKELSDVYKWVSKKIFKKI